MGGAGVFAGGGVGFGGVAFAVPGLGSEGAAGDFWSEPVLGSRWVTLGFESGLGGEEALGEFVERDVASGGGTTVGSVGLESEVATSSFVTGPVCSGMTGTSTGRFLSDALRASAVVSGAVTSAFGATSVKPGNTKPNRSTSQGRSSK